MKPGAPWSVKGIDPKAREVAKAHAHAQGKSLGEWMTQMILTAGEGGEGPAGQAALPPPGLGSGARSDGPAHPGMADPGSPAIHAAATAVTGPAPGGPPRAGNGDDPRVAAALVELSRRLEQIEQRMAAGTQGLSRDVA
ncbi:MAG: hypothetical protein RIB84_02710, partial [Sneathiellaceae bacterium]